jgi:hypothetical protein
LTGLAGALFLPEKHLVFRMGILLNKKANQTVISLANPSKKHPLQLPWDWRGS